MTKKQYFSVSFRFSRQSAVCVDSEKKGFDGLRFYDDEEIKDWPEDIVFTFDGGPMDDFLLGGLHWRLVSERVRQVFEENHIQGVQFLPVEVLYKPTGKAVGPYYAIHVTQSAKIATLRSNRSMDIFRLSTKIHISGELKHKLEFGEATSGFDFRLSSL